MEMREVFVRDEYEKLIKLINESKLMGKTVDPLHIDELVVAAYYMGFYSSFPKPHNFVYTVAVENNE